MAGKVIKGCFALAAAGGLIVVVLIAALLWSKKSTIGDVRALKKTHAELVALYGEVDDYFPPPSGLVAAPRMERFCAVRDSLRSTQLGLQREFERFPPQEVLRDEVEGLSAVKSVFKGLGRLIPPVIEYFRTRNEALLEAQMGLGEYLYIYSLVYYSWLGHSPADGPTYIDGGRSERLLDGEDSTFGRDETINRFHHYMEAILANQLAAELEGDVTSPEEARWRETLRGEYMLFKADPQRVPWQANLPAQIESSLSPYRDRLQDGYSATLNCFELAPMKSEEWELEWESK